PARPQAQEPDRPSPAYIGTRWQCSVLLCSQARAEPAELPRNGGTHELARTAIDTLSEGLSSAAAPEPQRPSPRAQKRLPRAPAIVDFGFSILDCLKKKLEIR